jgi:hypothetical protein
MNCFVFLFFACVAGESRFFRNMRRPTEVEQSNVCVITPIYYTKNRDFLKNPFHENSTFIVGVDDEREKQELEIITANMSVFVYKANGYVADALFAFHKGAKICAEKNQRFMFVYEMDVAYRRSEKQVSESLKDMLNETQQPFWILGSPYMGPLVLNNKDHLNGNAIYDLQSSCFAAALHHLLNIPYDGRGYDIVLYTFTGIHPVCSKEYVTTPRICNYWRTTRQNHVEDKSCWFVHY